MRSLKLLPYSFPSWEGFDCLLARLLCNLKLMPSFGKQNLIGELPAPPAKQITNVLLTFLPVFFFSFSFKNQKNCVQGFTSAVVQFRFNL